MFTKILSIVCFTFAVALILSAGGAQAQTLVSAKVLSIEGQVEIRRQPNDQPQIQKIAFKADDQSLLAAIADRAGGVQSRSQRWNFQNQAQR